jgi:hypothetical protein
MGLSMRITAKMRARVSGLLHNLSAAILVVHLVVGCCAHHAHDCPQTCEARHSEGTGDDAGTPCDGHSHNEQGQTNDHHHGPDECRGVKCSFVRAANDTIAKAILQLCQAQVAPLLDDVSASPGILSEQHFFAAGRLLLPVRLHLANQVLLI